MVTSPRGKLIVAGWVAVLLVASCQSTTSDPTDSSGDTYPDASGSPGISDSEISIAVSGTTDRSSDYWASNGPIQLAMEELADGLNADGGLLGRTIVPVPLYSGLTGDEPTSKEQYTSMCDFAVRQNPSFAVQGFQQFAGTAELAHAGCIGPERTINVVYSRLVMTEDMELSPDLVAPYALDDYTAARMLVSRLAEQGFFAGAKKVGVLNPGGTLAAAIRDVVVPGLGDLGVEDPFVLIGKTPGDSVTESEAQAASNALRLKAANVDRIVYFNDNLSGYYTISAMVDQGFTPPLGTFGNVNPETFIEYNDYPANRLSAVTTVAGYSITHPLEALPQTDTVKQCVEANVRTGMKLVEGASAYLLGGCDVILLTAAALEASGADQPSAAAFFDGLSQLDDFPSAFGISLDFSQGRTGASQVWDLRGDDSCSCLKVAGGPFPVEQ
jgi:hypothetical protein